MRHRCHEELDKTCVRRHVFVQGQRRRMSSRGNLVFSELGVVAEMGVISFKGVWGSFGYGLEVYVITVT